MHRILTGVLALLVVVSGVAAPAVALSPTAQQPHAVADAGSGATTADRAASAPSAASAASAVAAPRGVVAQGPAISGTVVVQEGETVNGFSAFAGTVIIRGTVNGDLEAYAGTVVVAEGATVNGRIRAYAGTVRIAGNVSRNVVAYSGNVQLEETGAVDGNFGAFGGSVTIAGTVSGDVHAGAGSITLEDTATVTGWVYYDGELTNNGADVGGGVESTSELNVVPTLGFPPIVVSIYYLLLNLLFGAILLLVFPDSSARVADRIVENPIESGAAGIVVAVGGILLAFVLLLSIIGIPLALVALFGWFLIAWVGTIYARIAIGALILARTELTEWWAPLVVGLFVVWLVVSVPVWLGIPFVSEFVRTIVTLFGMGSLALGLRDWYETAETNR